MLIYIMSSQILWNTPVVKIPFNFYYQNKDGNIRKIKPLTKSQNLASRNKLKSIVIEQDKNVDKIEISNPGITKETEIKKKGRKKKEVDPNIVKEPKKRGRKKKETDNNEPKKKRERKKKDNNLPKINYRGMKKIIDNFDVKKELDKINN